MAATEIRNGNTPVMEREVLQLSGRVTQQVKEILEEARKEQVPRTYLVYRMPSAGVRYYF